MMVHNFYQQPGGEDRVFADEANLLERRGHVVERFALHNSSIDGQRAWRVLSDTFWNRRAAKAVHDTVRKSKIAIVHFHNIFPLISPAAYYGARAAGAAVVQTLHNFRLLCPNALFLRRGRACEKCLGRRLAWPAAVHRCYRNSRLQSTAVAAMLAFHRTMGTWRRAVDAFICLSQFSHAKFIEGGLPPHKLFVKSNFVDTDPGMSLRERTGTAFVGRLGAEKGLELLLDAWRQVPGDVNLYVAGEGPLHDYLRRAAERDRRIVPMGTIPPSEVDELLGSVACLVVPSICYENQPRVVLEAFARGTPVAVPRRGAMAELVSEGRNGILFTSGDATDLSLQIRKLLAAPSAERDEMRLAARTTYEKYYTPDANYAALMSVYERALAQRRPGRASATLGA
jgi:glycosyltransferase involved in cell wall biosynthesis